MESSRIIGLIPRSRLQAAFRSFKPARIRSGPAGKSDTNVEQLFAAGERAVSVVTTGASGRTEIRQLLKFCVVGVANTAVTLGIIFLLRNRGVAIWPASTAGYLVGMVQGFVLNRIWTFAGRDHALPVTGQAAAFVAVNLVCSAVFGWLNDLLHGVLPLLASSLAATAMIVPLSYALNRWFVFRASTHAAGGGRPDRT